MHRGDRLHSLVLFLCTHYPEGLFIDFEVVILFTLVIVYYIIIYCVNTGLNSLQASLV